jgi:HSP20 family molecular chaperone IbpA
MAKIALTRVNEAAGAESQSLLRDLETLRDRIQERAYGIFERSGASHGSALDHWLEAERDLTVTPVSDLVEKDSAFELSLVLDGFGAGDLQVSALPEALIVLGNRLSESSEKTLYGRFDLPSMINVDQVTARTEGGILRVTAPKAVQTTTTADRRSANREGTPLAQTAVA